MAELICGPTAVITWTTSTGTTSLAADYRNVDWTPTIAYEDVSAGSDTHIGRLPTLKDATAKIEMVQQTAGTLLVAQIQPGQAGTLVMQPEGTASGKRKITFPAYCDGPANAMPYANVATLTIGWTGSSVLGTFSDSVN